MKMDAILHITRNMAELHHCCTLPLPNPAEPKDPYYAGLRPDNPGSSLLRGLRQIVNPDADPPENRPEFIPEAAAPHLLPSGLYDHYHQEMNREQERRLTEILKLAPFWQPTPTSPQAGLPLGTEPATVAAAD